MTWRFGCKSPGDGNAVTLRIHALLIAKIVAPLRTECRTVRRPDPGHRADAKANPGTNRRTPASAERRTGDRTDRRTDGRTGRTAYVCILSGSLSTDRLEGVLATLDIVCTELVERFTASREDQHARAVGDGRATGKRDKGDDR